ncbi:MAG: HEAT repeat domain-containing protein, partial [Chthonomonadales bacterium]
MNNTLAGIFWSGVGLAQFNMLIGLTPNERKSVYVGAMSAVTGLAGGVAPIVGGAILTAIEPIKVRIGVYNFGHFQIIFLMNSLFRYCNLYFFSKVDDPGASSARSVLSQLSTAGVSTWVQMHRLQNAPNEEGKIRAAHALRSARTALAVEELIVALDDPSHHVREEAAEALGEIGDARAIPALRDHLLDPASGIVGECAYAIGRIGDPEGLEPLAHLLREGIIQDRIVAAKAIGRIGSAEAMVELIGILKNPEGEPEALLESCLRSLSAEETPDNTSVIRSFMGHKARGVRLSAIRAAGDLCSPILAEPLQEQLEREEDESVVPQIAVSLAMTGDPKGVIPLLYSLQRVESPIARRQILNAIGIVLSVEEIFYPFLSSEASEKDGILKKLIRDIGKRAVANSDISIPDRRVQVRIDRAEKLATQDEFNAALAQIFYVVPDETSGPRGEVFAAIVADAEKREISQEEFVLALLAVT